MQDKPLEPHVVTVARATIQDGKVVLENHLPRSIETTEGQDLHLHLQYRFEEASREQEDFLIRLRSHLGDQHAPEASHHLRDHLWRPDAEWGFVRQVYDAPAAGKHGLFVDIEAHYGKHPWRGDGDESLDRAELATSVPVRVRP